MNWPQSTSVRTDSMHWRPYGIECVAAHQSLNSRMTLLVTTITRAIDEYRIVPPRHRNPAAPTLATSNGPVVIGGIISADRQLCPRGRSCENNPGERPSGL